MAFTRPRLLLPTDDLSGFSCGEPPLDTYAQDRALKNHESGASRCYVTTTRDEGGKRVAGYYAIATSSIEHETSGGWRSKLRRNQPDPISGILLTRLAVDTPYQRQKVGSLLLRDALLRTLQVAEIVGVPALFVHASNDRARAFYSKYDFESSLTDPLHMMLLIEDAKATFESR